MIRRKRAAIFTALWIAVMVIIFLFSNDDAEASSAKSGAVVMIVETVEEVLDLTLTQEIRAMTETIVRKCAHVFLYTCLGITGTLAVREYVGSILVNIQRKRKKFAGKSQSDRVKSRSEGNHERTVNAVGNESWRNYEETATEVGNESEENYVGTVIPPEVGAGKIRAVTALITYIFCFLYACTDEWHQTFRNGRSGSFRDVMIDSIGMILGIGGVTLITVIWNHFHGKTKDTQSREKA